MYKIFSVPLDQLNPEIKTIEVTINGRIFTILREKEICACDNKKETEELIAKGYPVCPMGVYDVLRNAKII